MACDSVQSVMGTPAWAAFDGRRCLLLISPELLMIICVIYSPRTSISGDSLTEAPRPRYEADGAVARMATRRATGQGRIWSAVRSAVECDCNRR